MMKKGENSLPADGDSRRRITLLPLALVAALSGKAVLLSAELSPARPVLGFVSSLAGDLRFLAAVLLLEVLQCLLRQHGGFGKSIATILRILLFLLFCFFLLHAAVFLAIDEKISPELLWKFADEWRAGLEFVSLPYLLAVALVIGISLLTCGVRRLTLSLLSAIALIMLASAGPLIRKTPDEFLVYGFDPAELSTFSRTPVSSSASPDRGWYSSSAVAAYLRTGPLSPPVNLLSGRPNIILLVVESLSAVDSGRLGAEHSGLPNFDAVSRDGTLFSRFFADTRQSEGAQISLMSGISPLPFPGSNYDWYSSFASLRTVPQAFRQAGYRLEMLSTFDSAFLHNGRYFRGLGFDRVRERDETPAFRDAPRFAFGAPSDEVLYAEALRTIHVLSESRQPFFFNIYTASSHLPWTAPQGKPNTQERVWAYVDEQFGNFYAQLRKSGFFDNGVLLVLGDHRKREPLSAAEKKKYGPMSRALIPLLIVGKGFPPGKIDTRFFQQADLLTKLPLAADPSAELSPYIFFLDDPPASYFLFEEADDGKNAHRFRLPSNSVAVEWEGLPPENSQHIEALIHHDRALNQERLKAAAAG
jgi:hypothetical protein